VSLLGSRIVRHLLLGYRFESGAAGQVPQEDLALLLVLRADETQSEEEAAEGVFVIPGIPLLGGDALLVPGHLAQSADEVVVGLDLLRRGRPGKPGKGD